MAFMVKHMVGGQLKNLTGGLADEKPEGEKTEAAAQGMTQEEFEQYQQQLVEENASRIIAIQILRSPRFSSCALSGDSVHISRRASLRALALTLA
ncbi:hypothetical protein JZ751_027195 [Albula glossodonta]|uniref:Complexin-3 n=1 Tax=Albula glossodonta TaxID=121402 RepID=A0A8T2NK53_9TELE|nr:hypothetical protein JZ751_027195 [Albula glossodonta]